MEPTLYQIELIDYATPSFITVPPKPYWGTPDELKSLLEALVHDDKVDALMPGQADAIRGLSRGEQNPEFLVPMNILYREEIEVDAWEGTHTNVWDYVTHLRAKKAVFEVAWVGNDKTWCRIYKVRFHKLDYIEKYPEPHWQPMWTWFCGFPHIIEQEDEVYYNRLWEMEVFFKDLDELEQDWRSREGQMRDPECFFEDVFGCG
jgi:hypothetical protein